MAIADVPQIAHACDGHCFICSAATPIPISDHGSMSITRRARQHHHRGEAVEASTQVRRLRGDEHPPRHLRQPHRDKARNARTRVVSSVPPSTTTVRPLGPRTKTSPFLIVVVVVVASRTGRKSSPFLAGGFSAPRVRCHTNSEARPMPLLAANCAAGSPDALHSRRSIAFVSGLRRPA